MVTASDSISYPSRPSMSSRASMDVGSSSNTAGDGGRRPSFQMVDYTSSQHQPTQQQQQQQQQQQAQEVVATTFDEATLRALCDTDLGLPLLYDRIKQSMTSTREASNFFKKRALIEEEYSKSLLKLTKSSLESYNNSIESKAGTFVKSYHSILSIHEQLAESRYKLGTKLNEMSEELNTLVKEVDRDRKNAKETGTRLERALLDAESGVEKARSRFDTAAEELERVLLIKSGEPAKGGELAASHAQAYNNGSSTSPPLSGSSGPNAIKGGGRSLGKAMSKGGMLFNKNKNPQQLLRQEEEIRSRTSQLSDTFRREVLQTQQMRQEYFNLQLPRILRSLKESAEEIDNGLQYHLSRYAFLYESTVLSDGMAITPVGATAQDSIGLKQAAESIDNRGDFKVYMQNYQVLHAGSYKGPRRQGPWEEGFVSDTSNNNNNHSTSQSQSSASLAAINKQPSSSSSSSNQFPPISSPGAPSRAIFGVDLAVQMARDNVEVPGILTKCAAAVETLGRENMGIYRLSGTTSKVQRLKTKFDTDWTSVDLFSDTEAMSDVNIISGCLKLWFRELPEPLLTWDLYQPFIDAAKIENERLRHIRLHEIVNQLPDANYSTLKTLMGHLDKIRAEESLNQMSASNLAIVFGPTLLNPPPEEGENALQDMQYQAKAIETVLLHFRDIFLEDEEIQAALLEEEERKIERERIIAGNS
ncbi:unnamed protein product [Sympodiomycopsis kandeliae]